MNAPPISEEVAVRIGLAAKALPEKSMTEVIEALQGCLGEKLDKDALSKITVKKLKKAFGQPESVDDKQTGDLIPTATLKEVAEILWGEKTEANSLPTPEPYQDGDMPNSVRIAIASNSGTKLDGHFGSCKRFLIYQVSTEVIKLIDLRSTAGDKEAEDKSDFRVDLIEDCDILYLVSIGGPPAAKVIQRGVYPIKIFEGGDSPELMEEFQQKLNNSPPPWLAKILGAEQGKHLKYYSEETINAR
ncbi:MAG: dinitrogenase iron-molybdenum cofactor biosynthesis protein [Cyanobacteria bacterium P01_E01_bin.42]